MITLTLVIASGMLTPHGVTYFRKKADNDR